MTHALASLALLLPLLLAACEAPPSAGGEPATDACGAAGLQGFVGQEASVVAATTFTQPIRVVGPDDVVTMDFVAERANFRTDAAGVITSVDCG